MKNCWEILSIEATKDIKEIKRAYSKLTATYHPEDDPEGFLTLKKAYNQAMSYAKRSKNINNFYESEQAIIEKPLVKKTKILENTSKTKNEEERKYFINYLDSESDYEQIKNILNQLEQYAQENKNLSLFTESFKHHIFKKLMFNENMIKGILFILDNYELTKDSLTILNELYQTDKIIDDEPNLVLIKIKQLCNDEFDEEFNKILMDGNIESKKREEIIEKYATRMKNIYNVERPDQRKVVLNRTLKGLREEISDISIEESKYFVSETKYWLNVNAYNQMIYRYFPEYEEIFEIKKSKTQIQIEKKTIITLVFLGIEAIVIYFLHLLLNKTSYPISLQNLLFIGYTPIFIWFLHKKMKEFSDK